MKQLLDAIDVLDNKTGTTDERTTARAALFSFRDKARDSAERLRRQLAYAEEFTDLLTARAKSQS